MDCTEWLKKFMDWYSWPVGCGRIKAAAKEAGYTRADLKAARKALKIRSIPQFDANATEIWFWYLEDENERE